MAAVPKLQSYPLTASRAAPAANHLRRNITALVLLGLCVGAYLTAQVRLAVLEAEKRQLSRALADVRTENTMLLRQVRVASAPTHIARAAKERGLRPPAGVDTVHPAALRLEQPGPSSPGRAFYAFMRTLTARLGLTFNPPRQAGAAKADRPS